MPVGAPVAMRNSLSSGSLRNTTGSGSTSHGSPGHLLRAQRRAISAHLRSNECGMQLASSRLQQRPAEALALSQSRHLSFDRLARLVPYAVVEDLDAEPAVATGPKLSDLPLQAIVNPQGYVNPDIIPGTAAAVFAVYDEQQKLQYIGFSKDLRSSLRTVLGRRPDKAYYFKAVQLPQLVQEEMLAVRQSWFDECGAPPPGNKLALERKAWQSAVDAGAISARAKLDAAVKKAKELQAALTARGCVEQFEPDPAIMAEGQVDFLQRTADQQEQTASAASAAAAASATTRPVRTATAVVDGQAKQFVVEYTSKFPTKGGYMLDLKVSFDHMETNHRVIIGKAYYEPYEVLPETAVEAALALMLQLKLPRHSEGMLTPAEFPVNYFTVSEIEQWWPEEFATSFLHVSGKILHPGQDYFWRMNKIHDYGAKLEDPTSLGAALSRQGLGTYGAGSPA